MHRAGLTARGRRYEELRAQLRQAQDAAEQEQDEAELARAAAAVARLTAPGDQSLDRTSANGAAAAAMLPVGIKLSCHSLAPPHRAV